MMVEWETNERFADARQVIGPAAIEATDFTGKIDLRGLPAGERIFYRVQFQDLRDLKTLSEPVSGTFVTPSRAEPSAANSSSKGPAKRVKIAFTGDVCGQGWGIDPASRWHEDVRDDAGRRARPVRSPGRHDLCRQPDPGRSARSTMASLWKNVTTEEKAHVAQSLDDFRGCYRYNLLDENVRRFNAVG